MRPAHHVTILAGGDSERMGRDKAAIAYRGEPLLVGIARRARSAADTVCVAGRERPEDWPLDEVAFIPDEVPDRGPLEGLRCALDHLDAPTALVACDMPLLDEGVLGWLLATHAEQCDEAVELDRHGLAIRRNGQLEPTFSIYHPAVLDLVERHLEAGRGSLYGLVEHGRFDVRRLPVRFDARLRNVNTPDEFDALPNNRS